MKHLWPCRYKWKTSLHWELRTENTYCMQILRRQDTAAKVSRRGIYDRWDFSRVPKKKKKTRPSIITDMEINKLVFQAYEAPNIEKSKTRSFPTPLDSNFIYSITVLPQAARLLCYASMSFYMLCLLTRVFCSPIFLKNSYSSLKTLFKNHSSCANPSDLPWKTNPFLYTASVFKLISMVACIAVFSPRKWEIWDKGTCMLRAQYLESRRHSISVFELN